LTGLSIEAGSLPLDPTQLSNYGPPHSVVADPNWRGHPHASVRRVHTQVQILDLLADNLDAQALNGDLTSLSIHAVS
jgi:hypothetical protein